MAWAPIYMKNVNLTLGEEGTGVDYKCQLTSVKLTPDVNTTKAKTLCPTGQFAEVDDPEWTLELGYLYGSDSATPDNGLADYLLAHKGTKVPFLFRPIADGPGYSGTVTLMPGDIGGDQGSFAEGSVSLPVDGQPVAEAAVTP